MTVSIIYCRLLNGSFDNATMEVQDFNWKRG